MCAGTPRSTQTPRSGGAHAHERPGSCDQPLHIQGSATSASAGCGELHGQGRLFRPQASHARLLPGQRLDYVYRTGLLP